MIVIKFDCRCYVPDIAMWLITAWAGLSGEDRGRVGTCATVN